MDGFLNARLLRAFLSLILLTSILQVVTISDPESSEAAAAGWQIQMMTPGKKPTTSWTYGTSPVNVYGNPGTTSFQSTTAALSGASAKTSFGAGEGVYNAFYSQTGITKVAFVDGSSSSLDPTTHTNYLIFDLVESTGSESFNTILKRLDTYISTCACQNNDSLWGSSSVLNLTAGTNGYSGTLSASGGTGFKTSIGGSKTAATPTKFAVYGINRDSDNDQQTMVAYSGDLNLGKGDSWRGYDPLETFWSYWGGDFHSSSANQRIGATYVQTTPGVATNASWTGNVYLLAYTANTDATPPTFPSAETFSVAENQRTAATITTSESAVIAVDSGSDSAKFSVSRLTDSSTTLSFVTAPNYEAPTDVGTNNTYQVVLKATDDASNVGYETITVTVTDANDPPVITSNSGGPTASISLAENLSTVTTVQATDEDPGATLSFSISGADSSDFSIGAASGVLAFAASPDYEAPADSDSNNIYLVMVTVSDSQVTDTQTITITVTNANESASVGTPVIPGTVYKGIDVTLSLTVNVSSVVRFFVNGKRISTCKDRVTSGTYPNNVATCVWKPSIMGRNFVHVTASPTINGFSSSTSPSTEVWVFRRTTRR